MTRTPPTATERALTAEVRRLGLTATHHQLERWRAKHWLAPTDQWTDPVTRALRPDIVHRATWLAALSRPGRGISWIGWTFWAIDGTEQTTALRRHALIHTLQLPLRQAGITLTQIPNGDSDTDFDTRQASPSSSCAVDAPSDGTWTAFFALTPGPRASPCPNPARCPTPSTPPWSAPAPGC